VPSRGLLGPRPGMMSHAYTSQGPHGANA
jgi:hypothetical protein